MSWLQSVDVALFRFVNQTLSCPILDNVMPFFSGNPFFYPALTILGILLVWKGGTRERLLLGMLIVILAAGEGLVIAPMKELVGRLRPFNDILDTNLLVGKGGSGSMPSSHTSNWFAATMVTFLFYRRSWRFMLPVACMVGLSRIYVGVHYPGDVLAGAILGAGYAMAGAYLLEFLWRYVGREWFPLWWEQLPSLVARGQSARAESGVRTREESMVPAGANTSSSGSGAPDAGALAGADEQVPQPGDKSELADRQWLRFGYLLITALFLFKLIYLAGATIQLSGDEAYQWLWSKHLALSYYSKPPAIAYFQFLGTSLWGDNELGVRFFAPVTAAIIGLLLLQFFAREVNARTGFWLVLAFHCTPLLAVGGTLMTVDPPLVMFWVAAMVAGWRAVQPDSTARNWLWVGLWMGLGFLSKYSALFQILCWAVFFVLWAPARQQLKRLGPYLALLVVAVSTIPVIIWNAQHDWVTLRHVGYDNMGLRDKWEPTLKYFGEFVGAELGLLNPIFFCATAYAAFAFWRKYRERPLFLYFFSMGAPVFLVHMLFTGWKRVLPNWIAPSVVPLFCLAALYFGTRVSEEGVNGFGRAVRRWLTAGIILGIFANVILHDTNVLRKITGRVLPTPLDPLRRVRAWSDTARAAGLARDGLLPEGKPVFFICSHYGLAGEVSFYLPEARSAAKDKALVYCPTPTVPGNQFYFWPGYREQRRGENAIYVNEVPTPKLAPGWFWKWLCGDTDLYLPPPKLDPGPPPEVWKEFDSVVSVGAVDIYYGERVFRRVQFYVCRNLH